MSGIPLRVFLGLAAAALVLAAVASLVLVASQAPEPVSEELIFYGSR